MQSASALIPLELGQVAVAAFAAVPGLSSKHSTADLLQFSQAFEIAARELARFLL